MAGLWSARWTCVDFDCLFGRCSVWVGLVWLFVVVVVVVVVVVGFLLFCVYPI